MLRGHRLVPDAVTVGDGRIADGPGPRVRTLALPDGWVICPGLVDLQVNGYAGVEVGDDPDGQAHMARQLARDGVTAFCPTLVSRDDAGYVGAARRLAGTCWPADGARPVGVHLEGPFLNGARAGVHRPEVLRPPRPEAVRRLAELFTPRIVTLAPELDGALAAIGALRRAGTVVAMGHTEADGDVVARAVDAGIRLVTHAGNAMPGVTARGPDGLACALLDRRVRVAVIGDGVHVHPRVLALLVRAAGPRAVLVSDAVAAAGMPPGAHTLAGRPVTSDHVAVHDADGRLAGSVAPLWTGAATLVAAGIPRARALAAITTVPRAVLGLGDGLAPGAPADVVILDDSGRPRVTLVGGVPCGPDPRDVLQ